MRFSESIRTVKRVQGFPFRITFRSCFPEGRASFGVCRLCREGRVRPVQRYVCVGTQ